MTSPVPGLALAETVAAEGRRLEAMGRSSAPGSRLVLAAVVAVLLHVGLFTIPVARVQGPSPALPPRPAWVSVLRWMPAPPASLEAPEVAGAIAEPPMEGAPPPPARGGPLPQWVLEPVPEPPPSVRLSALPVEASLLPVPPPDAEEALPGPVEVVRPLPIPESKVEPIYPPAARAMQARGTVVVEVLVGADGTVRRTRVLECTRPGLGFEQAAVRAVGQWSFRPGRVGDMPVEAVTVVRVEFR